jgi:ATP-dependent DNA ligase
MSLEIMPPYPPMEALSVEELPEGPHWQYEPKWDGFRCLAFRDGDQVQLQSKSCQPLARYFPEVVEMLLALRAKRFVLDGELAISEGHALSFDELLLRIHPAASRIKKLAREHPALFIAFDLLAGSDGKALVGKSLAERRPLLERFAATNFHHDNLRLSQATINIIDAKKWFKTAGESLDGIIAKRLDFEYCSGERTGMQKVKNYRSADCVVGGFRYASKAKEVGSLLLGLYDPDGKLHHVGFCSGIKNSERPALTKKLEALIEPPGFTGRAPGGPSRWSTARSAEWQPLKPKLVVEVRYDHFTGGRFRHGTRLLRWRPDKAPQQCTLDQVKQMKGNLLRLL